ncbi:MAG: NADH-quinone oxidoreductase subunit N [Bacteroidaceae bacterium]|nr:NADH-quinone oxidoreductase subunit N [Bacteroidaceae bacterium]
MDYSQFLNMFDELSLLAVIVIIFFADLFLCTDRKSGKAGFPMALPPVLLLAQTLLIAFSPFGNRFTLETIEAFGGMYLLTPSMSVAKMVLNTGTIIVFLMASQWLKRSENQSKQGEFYLLTLSTLLGMYFMVSSGHFLMFFIGLELASVPMTALVAFTKKNQESAESAAKYILTALFSSGLMLYGLSLIYGTTGTLYFSQLPYLFDASSYMQLLALVLFISGLGFKLSLVPFHLWTADTYQGAPTTVTGYLSVISKGAAAFVLFTLLTKVFSTFAHQWNAILFGLIVLSITIANIFAVRQQNIKRFMAYSSISQAGYLVLGIMGGTGQGCAAMMYYLFVYIVANLGVFAIINAIEQNQGKTLISDYDGLYQTNPKLSFLMTLCLFSLAGIPPFAGFFSKFFIFMAGFNAGFPVLVFIALVNTVISLYYYLLIVKAMYIKKNDHPIPTFRTDASTQMSLTMCILGVVLAGILSGTYQFFNQLFNF